MFKLKRSKQAQSGYSPPKDFLKLPNETKEHMQPSKARISTQAYKNFQSKPFIQRQQVKIENMIMKKRQSERDLI